MEEVKAAGQTHALLLDFLPSAFSCEIHALGKINVILDLGVVAPSPPTRALTQSGTTRRRNRRR